MVKTEVTATNLSTHLAKIQSIRQRLDHLALTALPEENQARYLTECNRHLLELKYLIPSRSEHQTSSDKTVQTEKLDQDETQIVRRSLIHQLPTTLEELSRALDKDFQRADLWLQRCLYWLSKHDYAAAMSDLMRAHRLDPTEPLIQQTLHKMKKIYKQKGKNFPLTSF